MRIHDGEAPDRSTRGWFENRRFSSSRKSKIFERPRCALRSLPGETVLLAPLRGLRLAGLRSLRLRRHRPRSACVGRLRRAPGSGSNSGKLLRKSGVESPLALDRPGLAVVLALRLARRSCSIHCAGCDSLAFARSAREDTAREVLVSTVFAERSAPSCSARVCQFHQATGRV